MPKHPNHSEIFYNVFVNFVFLVKETKKIFNRFHFFQNLTLTGAVIYSCWYILSIAICLTFYFYILYALFFFAFLTHMITKKSEQYI